MSDCQLEPAFHASIGLFVALTLTAGCQAGIGDPCESDADCASREICARQQCTRRCDSDDECPEERGFSCQPFVPADAEDPINVCLPESSADAGDVDNVQGCTTDRQCQRRFDSGRARCGLDGQCLFAPLHFGARITDSTTEPLPQDGAPGADIAAILAVEPESATDGVQRSDIVAVGRAVQYNPTGQISSDSHLDGSVPEFSRNGRCTAAQSAENVTPLGGEGGWVFVEFQRPEGGTTIEGFGQLDLVIIEWDRNCGAMTDTSDQFSAELCVTVGSEWRPEEDCGFAVGGSLLSGYTNLSIPDDVDQ